MLSMCLMAISLILPVDGDISPSYARKFTRTMDERVQNCIALAKLSDTMNAPTMLVLSIASVESGFRSNQISKAGARGLIGVMPSNMKGRDRKAHLAWEKRGIEILKYLLEKRGICDALAYYNAGYKGKCNGVGGGYASVVLERYQRMCVIYDREECSTC